MNPIFIFFVIIIVYVTYYPLIENFNAYRYRLGDMIKYKIHSDSKKWGFEYHKKMYPNSTIYDKIFNHSKQYNNQINMFQ